MANVVNPDPIRLQTLMVPSRFVHRSYSMLTG
jgi:hypothetical protein